MENMLPIFTVVLDNGGWAAVKEATLRMYPDGEAMAAREFQAARAVAASTGAGAGAACGDG